MKFNIRTQELFAVWVDVNGDLCFCTDVVDELTLAAGYIDHSVI